MKGVSYYRVGLQMTKLDTFYSNHWVSSGEPSQNISFSLKHSFIQREEFKNGERIVRELAVNLMNMYMGKKLGRDKWLKVPALQLKWYQTNIKSGVEQKVFRTSKPFTIRSIERLLVNRDFAHESLNLYQPKCNWLDGDVQMSRDFHTFPGHTEAITFAVPLNLGQSFPLIPKLDREGTLFNSFQSGLLTRIVDLRSRLIDESSKFGNGAWFFDFRSLLGDVVSLVDTTLHQVYFKAKYDPLPGWKFDEQRMGPTHGVRVVDKFGWIHQITGNHLNAHVLMKSFTKVKELRNHLSHFDPPCFCYSMEDAVDWMNDLLDIGKLLWKIRVAAGSPLSSGLIKFLLQPTVRFVPKNQELIRIPQGDQIGYRSSAW